MDSMSSPPAWRAFIHLYLPILIAIFFIFTIANPFGHRLPILLSGAPTYFLGSLVYPSDRPGPTPEQLVRFTRKHAISRAAVVAMYGRILGSPFNLGFFLSDLASSYAADYVIGERAVGKQRTSEFAVHVLWMIGTGILFLVVPSRWVTLHFLAGAVDRTAWRAAWLALVDDIIGVLAYPNLNSKRGKAVVILVQGVVIALTVLFTRFRIAMGGAEGMRQQRQAQAGADAELPGQ